MSRVSRWISRSKSTVMNRESGAGENEDMYRLQAVIVTESACRELIASVRSARLVPLDRKLSLLPVTDGLFGGVVLAEADEFWEVPEEIARVLAPCSAQGAVAYVEAEYFGGAGTQCAQAWDGGQTVLGPLRQAEDDPDPLAGRPISRVLRRLGVVKGDHFDEFAAVGLGRHRDTEDWLSDAT